MPCASLSPSFALRGICACGAFVLGSLGLGWGNLVGGKPEFVATADRFAQGAAVPTRGPDMPVGVFAQGADVPTLGFGRSADRFAHGAAVPMPELGIDVGLLAHGASVPSCGGGARAGAFFNDGPGPSLTS